MSFISKLIAFFSPEAEGTDGCFADMMGCENAKSNSQKKLGTQYIVGYLSFTLVIVWLLGRSGSLPLPSIMREYHQPEKISKFKI